MKKLILLLATVAFATTAWAQDTPKRPSVAGFVTNGFWDNIELSIGAGVGTALTNNSNSGDFGDRIGFEANIAATKWFHPIMGVRLQLQGGQLANFDSNLGKLKWPYIFLHSDFMLNFSNWAGGYRADRAYYAVPFVGFGYFASNFTDKSHEDNLAGTQQTFAFTYGLLNKFRISRAFDFNIELKGMLAPSHVCPAATNGRFLFGFSATAGFTYRFNQRDWVRGMSYSAADIQAFQDAVAASAATAAAMEAENARLAKQLADAKAQAAAARDAAAAAEAAAARANGAQVSGPEASMILFDYSMSTLTPQEKTRLELVAEKIKAGSKDTVYQIVGHADQQTGTKAGNERVAEGRAKNVFDFLVSKGVNPKQLNYKGKGNASDPFKDVQAANRAAIIQ